MVVGCLAVVAFIALIVGGVMYQELLRAWGPAAAHAFLAAAGLSAIGLAAAAVKLWKTPPPEA